MAPPAHWLPVTSRIAAAVFGGYFFTYGFTALVVAANFTAGGAYFEGLLLAYLLAFLVYLGAFFWAFASAHLVRVWLVLAGGGAVMTGLAWQLGRSALVPT